MPDDSFSSPDAESQQYTSPPKSFNRMLVWLGPGMIIAGSIVGSGELIATTKVGAEAGFWLLWLIIVGCVIKVFAQVEFGRYTITYSETPLTALNQVPGPRFKTNWLIWYWCVMMCLIIGQQGGIVGGVGQALSITVPLTDSGREYNQASSDLVDAQVQLALARNHNTDDSNAATIEHMEAKIETMRFDLPAEPNDSYIWAAILAVGTSIILYVGHYGFIQAFSTVMVVGFTLVTIFTVIMLQAKPDWAISGSELASGLQFRLPPKNQSLASPLATALAAFGIIGVGASELIMYPYWCMEKGYAKFTGPRDCTQAWADRARGWLRVLRLDAWTSMLVYTFATIAFYLLGAAVLGRVGLNPEKGAMVRTLAQMYVPVFGSWAPTIFLIGAIAVLYSTYFVAAAGCSRVVADALGLFGFHDGSESTRMKWARNISTIWPLVAMLLYCFVQSPTEMVLASGVSQSIMLPMLGFAALYFRYKRCDQNLLPTKLWDLFLWLSFAGLMIAGVYTATSNIAKYLSP